MSRATVQNLHWWNAKNEDFIELNEENVNGCRDNFAHKLEPLFNNSKIGLFQKKFTTSANYCGPVPQIKIAHSSVKHLRPNADLFSLLFFISFVLSSVCPFHGVCLCNISIIICNRM